MKNIICLAVLFTLAGCGIGEELRSYCGSDIEMGCNALFGYKDSDQDKRLDAVDAKNKEQDEQIALLKNQMNNQINLMNSVQGDLALVNGNITNINNQITDLQNDLSLETQDRQNQINGLSALLTTEINNRVNLSNQVSILQSQVNSLMSQMVAVNNALPMLQSNINGLQNQINTINVTISTAVVGMVDPCGDGPGFDEVLLKTKDGKYVAYFETGGNRFLTVLQTNTSYQTTDAQHCNFSINSSGVVTW